MATPCAYSFDHTVFNQQGTAGNGLISADNYGSVGECVLPRADIPSAVNRVGFLGFCINAQLIRQNKKVIVSSFCLRVFVY
jgi:hypothetical protein